MTARADAGRARSPRRIRPTRPPGTRSSRRTRSGRTSSSSGWARVKAVNGWRRGACSTRRRTASAPRCCSAAPGRCRGRSPMRPAARCSTAGTTTRSARFTELAREGLRGARSGRGPREPPPDRPRDRARRGPGRGRRGRRRAARPRAGSRRRRSSRSRPASIDLAADEDALWGDLRKKWRQYVNKARTGGVRVVDAGPERLDDFYRDLPRDRRPGGLPDPGPVGLPRRVGRVRARRATPGSCSRSSPTARRSRRCSSSGPAPASWSRTAA